MGRIREELRPNYYAINKAINLSLCNLLKEILHPLSMLLIYSHKCLLSVHHAGAVDTQVNKQGPLLTFQGRRQETNSRQQKAKRTITLLQCHEVRESAGPKRGPSEGVRGQGSPEGTEVVTSQQAEEQNGQS